MLSLFSPALRFLPSDGSWLVHSCRARIHFDRTNEQRCRTMRELKFFLLLSLLFCIRFHFEFEQLFVFALLVRVSLCFLICHLHENGFTATVCVSGSGRHATMLIYAGFVVLFFSASLFYCVIRTCRRACTISQLTLVDWIDKNADEKKNKKSLRKKYKNPSNLRSTQSIHLVFIQHTRIAISVRFVRGNAFSKWHPLITLCARDNTLNCRH